MPTHRLAMIVSLDCSSDEDAISRARSLIGEPMLLSVLHKEEVGISLTREGDRSGGNLLLPRTEGRTGSHLQSRRTSFKELAGPERHQG